MPNQNGKLDRCAYRGGERESKHCHATKLGRKEHLLRTAEVAGCAREEGAVGCVGAALSLDS